MASKRASTSRPDIPVRYVRVNRQALDVCITVVSFRFTKRWPGAVSHWTVRRWQYLEATELNGKLESWGSGGGTRNYNMERHVIRSIFPQAWASAFAPLYPYSRKFRV